MRQSLARRTLRKSGNVTSWFALLVLCVLNGGCLALTRERVIKPVAPAKQILTHWDNSNQPYSRFLDFRDFALEVGVENGPSRWEMGFLFWVLPLPYSVGGDDGPFLVQMHFTPKSQFVTFNPWQVYFLGLGTNLMHAGPAEVWQDGRSLGTNAANGLVVTKDTSLTLKFSPWAQMFPDRTAYQMELHPDRDAQFELSFEGSSPDLNLSLSAKRK
jgi:hypothetical protein